MTFRLTAWLTGSFMAFALTATAAAQWHTPFGGNERRNGFVDVSGPKRIKSLWNQTTATPFASSVSCPVIANGRLFVARESDISDIDNGSAILAYDVRTGVLQWATSIPPEIADQPNPNLRGPNHVIGYHQGTLYATRAGAGSRVSRLYGLNPATGQVMWQSPERVFTANVRSASPAFLPDGDIILAGRVPLSTGDGTTSGMLRVDGQTGAVLWRTNENTFRVYGDDSMSWAINGDRGYAWDQVVGGASNFWVSAFDLETGARLHSAPVPGFAWPQLNLAQQAPLMVGHDGTVYVNRLGVSLTALRDSPTGFTELWQRPMGGAAFQSNAVGIDGSVYIMLTDPLDPALRPAPHHIVRLDPTTGAEMARSRAFPSTDAGARMAIDRDGTLFVTNMGLESFGGGRLYAFSPDLQQQYWEATAPNTLMGGIALGDGIVAAACTGTIIRVYGRNCVADHNGNDQITVEDIFRFLADWFANEEAADANGDEQLTVQDIFDFLAAWFAGC